MRAKPSILPSLLSRFLARIGDEDEAAQIEPILEKLHSALLGGSSCLQASDFPEEFSSLEENFAIGPPDSVKPLVLAPEGNLYFRRYFEYEQSLATSLLRLANNRSEEVSSSTLSRLNDYFGKRDDQMAAARIALTKGVSIVTGGPGTGKTYLAVGVIAALLAENPELSIALAAPTGKAAHRMRESIENNLRSFPLEPEVASRFPTDAKTIHRLLRPLPPSIHFRRNQETPLVADVVLVDESSMIDLPLMAKLLQALKPEARLILVGDADQLAPVEAGSPFASMAAYFASADTPDALAVLNKNQRFGPDSSIHWFCQRVRENRIDGIVEFLREGDRRDFVWASRTPESSEERLKHLIRQGYAPLRNAQTPEEAYASFLKFQVLCPTNDGDLGVNAINKLAEELVGPEGRSESKKPRYRGLPILIEQNDYSLGVFNGDVGIVFPASDDKEKLLAWFPDEDGTMRPVSTTRLPPHRPAYAMTIHRSQGSEYEEVAIVLPERESEILNRNLLYVAASRAKEKVHLFSTTESVRRTMERAPPRGGGLEYRLAECSVKAKPCGDSED